MPYRFTQDWVSKVLRPLDLIMRSFDPVRILEIGSFEGRSAVYFIEKIAGRTSASLTCIDPWMNYGEMQEVNMSDAEDAFDYNTALALEGSNVVFSKLKGPSIKMLSHLIANDPQPYDLVYIDGSHKAPDVFADAALAFHLTRNGGVMVFDDYATQALYFDPQNHAQAAVDAFKFTHANLVEPIYFGPPGDVGKSLSGANATYQCYLRKL